jgi:ATP-dependent DNA helicase DinG
MAFCRKQCGAVVSVGHGEGELMSRQETEQFFGSQSPLSRPECTGRGFVYEPRPQQVAMALGVAAALDDDANLCVEAPTGVGKTFAYLVPAYYHAVATGQPVVISTHTINLQEQILHHDVPLLSRILGVDLEAVVAKGRGNYLCLRRLAMLADLEQQLLPGGNILGEISILLRWVQETDTGDRAELSQPVSPQLWAEVCSESGNCLVQKCPHFRRCFVTQARERLHHAQIIVANHAFLFSALAMTKGPAAAGGAPSGGGEEEGGGLLPGYSALILDEGHTLEECASMHLGLRADTFTLRRALGRLYHDERQTGLLGVDEAAARAAVDDCRRRVNLFFDRLLAWLEPQNQNPLRYTCPNHIEHYLEPSLSRVLSELEKLVQAENDASRKSELEAAALELQEQNDILASFFAMLKPDHVYWFERHGRDLSEISFHVVPVDVSPLLQELLFSRPPVVVTSATLAVQGDMGYFQHRLGAYGSRSLILDSPFDYQRQVKVHIGQSMPEPSAVEPFCRQAAEHIRRFLRQTHGRAFVLFTSYSMMHRLAADLQAFFQEEGLTVLEQGGGLPPRKMLEEFKATPGAVIFGTASFWTGVDVPGDALSNVIITRLPFAVPDHPLTAARIEKIESQNGNAFRDYSIPEAVLKFRQGFGRLIRTRSDTGIVVILDSRVIRKRYGISFLGSIPACPVELF